MKKIQQKGALITIEGIDCSGKSTLAKSLKAELEKINLEIVLTKEPGGTKVGKKISSILGETNSLNTECEFLPLTPLAEFLLFCAARNQHINQVVKPALKSGKFVISDRMADSSRAYQGFGRNLSLNFIERVTKKVMEEIEPDSVFYLKLDFKTAWQRMLERKNLSRIEKEKGAFFEKVIKGFDEIFKNRDNVIILDAKNKKEDLVKEALEEIKTRFLS